jgi:hypothetical protein
MPDLLLQAPLISEPHRKNRFILRFPTDIGIQSFTVKSCDMPKMNMNNIEIPFLNTSTFVAGRYVWQKQNIVLRDFLSPSTSQGLIGWLRLHAESATGRMGYAVGYAKTLQLDRLDPAGVVASTWIMENCIIADDIDFGGTGDYADDELAELSFTVQPQKCELLF